MRTARRASVCSALALAFATVPAVGQEMSTESPLFAAKEAVEVTLSADFSLLEDDRRGDPPERPATVILPGVDGESITVEAQLRTRGRFRRDASNCTFPPLRLNLKVKQTEGTVFDGQDKLKIVGSCRPNRDSYEDLVLMEYLTYESLRLLTDTSFKVRLARITYVDESGENDTWTRYAFFIEDDDILAARFGATVFDLEEGKNLPPGYLDPPTAATMGVFAYMIGNTDWSDIASHNVELLSLGGIAIPVPYDFDFSGLVDAPYAIPDPSLGIDDVRERYYRGWCWDMDMSPIVQRFWDAREEILALWSGFELLDEGKRDGAVRYLEAFFEEVETPERAQRRFLRDCRAIPG